MTSRDSPFFLLRKSLSRPTFVSYSKRKVVMADDVLAAISAGHPTAHKAAAKHQTRRTEKAKHTKKAQADGGEWTKLAGLCCKVPCGRLLTPGPPLPDTTCNRPAVPMLRANSLAARLAKLVSIGMRRARCGLSPGDDEEQRIHSQRDLLVGPYSKSIIREDAGGCVIGWSEGDKLVSFEHFLSISCTKMSRNPTNCGRHESNRWRISCLLPALPSPAAFCQKMLAYMPRELRSAIDSTNHPDVGELNLVGKVRVKLLYRQRASGTMRGARTQLPI